MKSQISSELNSVSNEYMVLICINNAKHLDLWKIIHIPLYMYILGILNLANVDTIFELRIWLIGAEHPYNSLAIRA